MNKTSKMILGLVTLWPFFYLILFFVMIFSFVLLGPGGGGGETGPPPMIAFIFPLHLLTMLISFALMVFYIVNVFKNKRIENDKKALWAVVLFFGGMLAMPVYWYLFIWKDEAVTTAPTPAQLGGMDASAWTSNVNAQQPKQEQYVPPSQPPDWR